MTKLRVIFSIFAACFLLSACSSVSADATYPKTPEDKRLERNGKLTGDDGLVLFSSKAREGSAGSGDGASGIGVNSYLWRSTLDTLSFMPLASADPFGGVIITDWYQDPTAKGERFKVNALIMDKELQSNAVKITVFKQKQVAKGWVDTDVPANVSRELEDKILTRARQLRVARK